MKVFEMFGFHDPRSTIHASRLICVYLCLSVSICLLCTSAGTIENPVAMFHKGKLEESRELFLKHLANNPDEPVALYYMGLLTTEPPTARKYFERLLRAHPKHELADDALFQIGESDFAGRWGLYRTARRKFLELLREYPESEHIPTALYRIAVTYRVTADEDSAVIYQDRLRSEFPNSEANLLLNTSAP